MADKKIFPGLSEQDVKKKDEEQKKLEEEDVAKKAAAAKKAEEDRIAEQKRQEALKKEAEEKRIAEQKKQEAVNFENSAKALLKKFGKNKQKIKEKAKAYKDGAARFMKTQLIPLGVFYVLWLMGMASGGEFIVEGGRNDGFNFFATAVSSTDLDKSEKVIKETGSVPMGLATAAANPLLETYNFSNITNQEAYQNLEKGDLRVVRAYVGLILVILGSILAFKKTKNELDEINQDNRTEQNQKLQDIKKLLTMWKNKDVNNMKMEDFKYVGMIKTIISHMSSKDATLFRQMLAGETYVSSEVASSIMTGHLKSHPEDAKLILDTFEEKYMPADLVTQCKQIKNQKQYC